MRNTRENTDKTPHNEKCRKYKQEIENLKLDLEELQEKYDKMISKINVNMHVRKNTNKTK